MTILMSSSTARLIRDESLISFTLQEKMLMALVSKFKLQQISFVILDKQNLIGKKRNLDFKIKIKIILICLIDN